jgi:tetratricopeptide (TPR) repeat protein
VTTTHRQAPTAPTPSLLERFWQSTQWEQDTNPLPLLINQLHQALEQCNEDELTTPQAKAQTQQLQGLLAASYWQQGQCQRAVAIAQAHPQHPLAAWVLGSWCVRQGQVPPALAHLARAKGHYQALDGLVLASIWEARAAVCNNAPPKHWGHRLWWGSLLASRLLRYAVAYPQRVLGVGQAVTNALIAPKHWLDRLNHQARQLPGCALWPLLAADTCLTMGLTDQAKSHYLRLLDRHPANVEAVRGLLTCAEGQDDVLAMVALVERLEALVPNDPQVPCYKGNLAQLGQRYDQALGYYQQALLLSASGDAQWQVRLLHSMADLYEHQFHDTAAASQALIHALTLQPQDLATRHRLCALLNQDNQLSTARLLCQQAVTAQPNLASWHTSLGFVAWREGALPEAKQAYLSALALNPDDEVAANNLAVIYLDWDATPLKAAALLERVVAKQPQYALAYFNLGRAYSLTGHAIEAAQSYHQAQTINDKTHELDANDLNQRIADLFTTNSQLLQASSGSDEMAKTINKLKAF